MKRRRQPEAQKSVRKPFRAPRRTSSNAMTVVPVRNAERKFVDLNQVGRSIPGAGSATASSSWNGAGTVAADQLCNGLATGTGANNRIGRKIVMKSIYMRFTWFVAGSNTSQSGPMRILVVYDKQVNGAFPTAIAPATSDGAILHYDHIASPNNLFAADRYVTIFDELVEPLSGVSNPGAPCTRTVSRYKKINLPVIFNNGTAGDITDISMGAVYIIFCVAGVVSNTAADYTVRIRFEDE